MTAHYQPRPERWPQFTLRGLLVVVTLVSVLTATVLPSAIATCREWMDPRPSDTIYNFSGSGPLPGPDWNPDYDYRP